jgi:hypothetical protein
MNLDVGTLFSVTVLVMALLGILLIGTWLQNRGMRALAWWGAAYLVGGMSIWLLGARGGTIQDLLSIDIANALLFVACGLTWSGARLFDGRGVKPVAMLIGTFMWVGACQIPGFMASLDARVVLSSIIISGYTMVMPSNSGAAAASRSVRAGRRLSCSRRMPACSCCAFRLRCRWA